MSVTSHSAALAELKKSSPENADMFVAWLERARNEDLFDAIVVDEGQDLSADSWAGLELCQRSKTGHFYVFSDDNQRLTKGTPAWPANLIPYMLTRNLRNTQPICALSLPHYSGPGLKAAGPVGRAIEWIEARGGSETLRQLERVISRLLGPDEMKAESIVILTPTMRPPFSNAIEVCGVPLVAAHQGATGRIVLDTIKEFKGLERPLVVLLNPEDCIDDPEQMYTALTRARSHLIVIGSPEAMAIMKQVAEKMSLSRKR